MKTVFPAIALGLTTLFAGAQGTINFGNSSVTPISVRLLDGTQRLATAADDLFIGAFYGPAGSSANTLVLAPGLATIGPTDGLMFNAPSLFPIPGTEPAQDISLQIRVWNAALGPDGWRKARQRCAGQFYGETRVGTFPVGPTLGPGTPIWQSWQGVNPERFYPLTVYACPEPSTFVLAAVSGLGWLIFLRRRKHKTALRQGNETTAPDRRP